MRKLLLLLVLLCLPVLCAQETYIPSSGIAYLSDCSGVTGAGSACVDSDTDVLYIGDGTTAIPSNLSSEGLFAVDATISAELAPGTDYCFTREQVSATSFRPCTQSSTYATMQPILFNGDIWLDHCLVTPSRADYTTATDVVVLTAQYSIGGAGFVDFTQDFRVQDRASVCAPTTNCSNADLETFTWTIEQEVVGTGYVSIRMQNTDEDTVMGNDDPFYVTLECFYK